MLRKLTLSNFQSHEKTELEFGPGVNVLVGPSNSGKTAVFRALRWVWLNRPLGTSFIREGTKESRVAVELETPGGKVITIERIRGPRRNEYVVNGKVYGTPSRESPEEVTEAFGLDDLNVQMQLDKPFGVLESPGTIASLLSKAAGLDRVEEAIGLLSSEIRQKKVLLAEREAELSSVETHLEGPEFRNLKRLEEGVSRAATLLEKLAEERRKLERLSDLVKRYQKLREEFRSLKRVHKKVVSLSKLLEEAKSLQEHRRSLKKQIVSLLGLLERFAHLDEEQAALETERRLLQGLNRIGSEIERLKERRENTIRSIRRLHELISRFNGVRCQLDTLKAEVLRLEHVKEEELRALGVCPLCRRPL